MPTVGAITQPAATARDLNVTVPPISANGTWFGFISPGAILTSTLYNVFRVLLTDGTLIPNVKLVRNASNALLWQGSAVLTGPTFTNTSPAHTVALVMNGLAGTFFWKPVNSGVWSSATNAAFISSGGPYWMTSVNALQAVAAPFIGSLYGWRFWSAPNNPTTAADLDVESRSLQPVRRGAVFSWPFQGNTADNSGSGRTFFPSAGVAVQYSMGAVLGTQSAT